MPRSWSVVYPNGTISGTEERLEDPVGGQRRRELAGLDLVLELGAHALDLRGVLQAPEEPVAGHLPGPVDLLAGALVGQAAALVEVLLVAHERRPHVVEPGALGGAAGQHRHLPGLALAAQHRERLLELAGRALRLPGVGAVGLVH